MSAYTFRDVTVELRRHGHEASTNVSLEEQLAIFLYTCVTGLSIRHVGERFQRSNDTISRYVLQSSLHLISDHSMHRYFCKMVAIFSSEPLHSKFVSLLPSTNVHPAIDNYRFMPYFKDCVGAIDGSHIPASPPHREHTAYRNRKGFLSQNCLFACDFSMQFIYMLTGWEGSATDARVFQDACASSLVIPQGKYLLGDAGFPASSPHLLVPYRSTRYHLAEWRQASLR